MHFILDQLSDIDLTAEVLSLLRQIPSGRVTTYGDLARALGDDRTSSARWLGEFLGNSRTPHEGDGAAIWQAHLHLDGCPCYRVVRSNGEIGLHCSGDPLVKAKLLRNEGVTVSESGRVDLALKFDEFAGSRPLERLKQLQLSLARDCREEPLRETVRTIAAADVAYRADGIACGAYGVFDAESLELLYETTLFRPAPFPYIPGYLTWRELPVILELCEIARQAGQLGDVLLCDGNGRLHPWRAGIAVCLGVSLNHPVIGVGKSLLCGSVDRDRIQPDAPQPVVHEDEVIGQAMIRKLTSKREKTAKPIYVSVGHRITLSEATAIVEHCFRSHRIPEPIFQVDAHTKRLRESEDQ